MTMTDREENSPEMNGGEDIQREIAVTTEKENKERPLLAASRVAARTLSVKRGEMNEGTIEGMTDETTAPVTERRTGIEKERENGKERRRERERKSGKERLKGNVSRSGRGSG